VHGVTGPEGLAVSDLMGERGVMAFGAAALKLGWIVRRQHESDQGIDAQVEKVEFVKCKSGPAKEVSTGRLIAVQIKSGESWFRRATKTGGWWFSFAERERNLWLNHALPVIVAMYHPDHDQVYWQRISAATITKAKTRYRVEVPATQTVATAGEAWTELSSGDERRAESRFQLSLQGVSPTIAKGLSARPESERADAAVLAMHLADGRMNPKGTAAALLTAKPRWITDNAGWAWGLVAHYCSDHDLMVLAADAFELSAQACDGDIKTRALVAAASHRAASDREAAKALVELADANGGEPVLRAAARSIALAGADDPHGGWMLDPSLVAGGPAVDASAAAQRLLCGRARARQQLDDAVEHAENALKLDPLSSETMVLAADCVLGRWSTRAAKTADLLRGIELLRQALAQRKAWAGPVREIRRDLARSLAMAGEFDEVLRLALPPPGGDAEAADLDPVVLRIGAHVADELGRTEALDQAVSLMGDTPEDRLAKAQSGALDLSLEEMTELRLAGLDAAEKAADYTEIAQQGVALCSDGVDVVDRLRPYVDQGVLPMSMLRLCSALALIPSGGLDAALPALRELAKTDGIAAEHLLGRLRQAGRFAEAAEQARQLFEITNAAPYLLQQARALIGAKDIERAVDVSTQAIALNDIRPHDRADLLTFLGAITGEKEDWALGERYFRQALELVERPGPNLVWNMVVCQVQQGRIAKAAQTVAKYHPPVRDKRDAELWLRANAASIWNERTAFEAFALAQRFDDPKLSTALVGAIVTRTHGVGGAAEQDDELEARRRAAQGAVPGELHRQAFEFIEQLVDRYGDETGITVLKGTDEELLDQMVEQLKDATAVDPARREIITMARDGRIPLGLVAAAFGRCHSALEVQRVLGIRLAGAIADDEHEVEVAAAQSALNKSVVLDPATVVTLTWLTDPDAFTGHFVGLLVPPAAMLDLHRLSDDVRGMAGSPGSLRWDEDLAQVVMIDLSDEEFMRLLDRAESVQRYVDRLAVRSPGPATVYAELRKDETQAPWLDVLQLTADEQAVLWSDDLGMRRAARAVGVTAFGTPALVDALRDNAIAASTTADEVTAAITLAVSRNLELARDHVVDLMLGLEDVLVLADGDGWKPRAGAVAIARPSFWMWNDRALTVLKLIYKRARADAPDSLVEWQMAAMHGAAQLAQPEAAAAVLAILALVGFGEAPNDLERADALRRARGVATKLGLPDPAGGLPRAARILADGSEGDDPATLVKRILGLVEDGVPT
jgi:tetratricopeptide (TPR) repeat protein